MAVLFSKYFRRRSISWLLSFIICLTLVTCSTKGKTPLESADVIRIGVINTTGIKPIEESTKRVVDMISQKIELDNGLAVGGKKFPVSFVERGIEGHIPEQAVRAAKELINQENVVAIVGPHSSIDAIPAGEVAEQAGIPLIAPVSTHPRTTDGRKYIFRVAFLDEFQAESIAGFALEDLGVGKAAVLFNTANPYSRELAEVFKNTIISGGGEVVSYEYYVSGETVFTSQLKRIRESDPEVLFLPNYHEETVTIVRQVKKAGINAVLLGVDSWHADEAKDIHEYEGAYMVDYVTVNALTGDSKAFVEKYQHRYGEYPASGVILVYDAFGILLSAMRHAQSFEPEAIRDALYEMGPYDGVGGRIDFIDSGDPEREAVIVSFENGQIRHMKRIIPESEEGGKEK